MGFQMFFLGRFHFAEAGRLLCLTAQRELPCLNIRYSCGEGSCGPGIFSHLPGCNEDGMQPHRVTLSSSLQLSLFFCLIAV